MKRVRVKDLALVAFAGGLLAFELVALGEALPGAKQAIAAASNSGQSTSSTVVTLARNVHRSRERIHLVTVKSDGSCAMRAVAPSAKRLREVERAVEMVLKQATL